MLQQFREGAGRWVAVIILGLIAVAFIFWGVNPTIMGTTFAAKVNGEDVSLAEFERQVQDQQTQYQELYRLEISDDLRRELRLQVLERLVRNEALAQRVGSEGYAISNERLTETIRSRPEFQVDGEFSFQVYQSMLTYQGLSMSLFEEQQRGQLQLLELQNGVASSAFYTPGELTRYVELYNQQREVAYALFEADGFRDQVELDESQIVAYYEDNKLRFYSQESVDLEYVELLQADLAEGIELTDEILESYYEDEQYRFQTDEERRARHILINSPAEDPEAEARAAEILTRLEAGEDFEALADELSEDGGTSSQGGDLGWLGRGLLVGPFEDTLFAMALGDVEGPVKTDFGYHIIRLDEIREGEVQSFESVKEELAGDYQNSRAEELFYAAANELADRAFDAFDELASVAADMELSLRTFDGFTRTGSASPFPASAPVVQAAFSAEVLGQGENSGLIEITDDHVVVVRVATHYPPAEQALEAVTADIEEELTRAAAETLAGAAAAEFLAQALDLPIERAAEPTAGEDVASGEDTVGEAAVAETTEDVAPAQENAGEETVEQPVSALAALVSEHGGAWTAPRWIERTDATVPTEILATAFRAQLLGADAVVREQIPLASGDQAVALISGVRPGDLANLTREEQQRQVTQLAEQTALYELSSYAGRVREQATVRIPDEILDPPLF